MYKSLRLLPRLASPSTNPLPRLQLNSSLKAFSNPASRAFITTTQSPLTKPQSASFATMTNAAAPIKVENSDAFFAAIQQRHSYYALNKEAPISQERVLEIIQKAIVTVPSSFNSQSARLVVLLGEEHNAFWDLVLSILKTKVSEEQYPVTEKKIHGFRAAYGSILFYENNTIVEDFSAKFPTYADRFPQWSEHANAMHQFALWTALEAEGFGANLQHYNPLVDKQAAEKWNVPKEWSLKSQLVFGGHAGTPPAVNKPQTPMDQRLFVYGASN